MPDTTATWSVQYRDAGGFNCTLTIAGPDEKTVLDRARECLARLRENGAQPACATGAATPGAVSPMYSRPLAEGQGRILITKLVRTSETQADLYGQRHRYPDLKLFDLSELAVVGIDFANLPTGQPVPCRFFAVYEESKRKQKSTGTPYRDVLWLEPPGDVPAFHLDSQVESEPDRGT
jgi:hypothetical protein